MTWLLCDPLATTHWEPDWVGVSDEIQATYGAGVGGGGDVNGDGLDDVVVGATTYGVAGGAVVYFGSATGLETSPSSAVEGEQAGEGLGCAVAMAGDVDGDGYTDVVAGAKTYANGSTTEGRALVFRGSASGLEVTAAWSAESNEQLAYFGSAVSTAGDVDGDGFADIVIGAPHYHYGDPDEGRAFVYMGSSSGVAPEHAWSGELTNGYAAPAFGTSVAAAGDVDRDGYGDVIVGAPDWRNGELQEGAALLYRGSSAGLATEASWMVEADAIYSMFGTSVSSAGDVNGDGFDDVVVGAWGFPYEVPWDGAAFVFLGSATGLATTPAYVGHDDHQSSDSHYGWSVSSAGDVNADGYDDIVVGAPEHGNGAFPELEGRAVVILGSSLGPRATESWAASSLVANADFGKMVSAAGDVNGDGYADVIVGAPGYGQERAFVYNGEEAPDADGDGILDPVDACLGDNTSGDLDLDGVCALDLLGAIVDCDDLDPTTFPGAPELCEDATDNNCDGEIDEGCPDEVPGETGSDTDTESVTDSDSDIGSESPDGCGCATDPGVAHGALFTLLLALAALRRVT